ncbi:MAG: site-2 protease family protein [Bacteroidaceae bacterium]|nr:site-2 protease family protein [Bacteroidaceae bacterium]
MTVILIKAAQLMLALFIITTVHEVGHLLWARLLGEKVEEVQIFGFSFLGWTSRRSGTRYSLGWLPFGGCCLMPDIHKGQKPWKKLIVFSGGVINNLLLSIVIFMAVSWYWTPSQPAHSHIALERGAEMFTSSVQIYGESMAHTSLEDTAGVLAMGDVFYGTWRWFRFWFMTAYFSMIMAFINIVPIPGLDGGQILFAGIEAVIRRPIPERVRLCANLLGLFLVLALVIYGNYNDIRRFILT